MAEVKKAPKKKAKKKAGKTDPSKAAPPTPPEKKIVVEDDPPSMPTPEADEGAPGWVTTFADLMSLLMCFFVMLLSMAQIDVEKFKALAEGMAKAVGSAPNVALKELSVDDILSEAESIKTKLRLQTLGDAKKIKNLLINEIKSKTLEMEVDNQMITLRILQGASFPAGSADFRESFMPVTKKLRQMMVEVDGFITVGGHTDDSPIKSKKYRSNWELSGSRAFSMINALLKSKELKPERFVLVGHAETRPIVPNDTSENRARNRRVEVVIDQRGLSLDTLKKDSDKAREVFAPEIERGEIEVEETGPEGYEKRRQQKK